VVVEREKKRRYGRVVGKVLVGGEDACLEQVSAGYALHHEKYQNAQTETDRQSQSEAEIEAGTAKRGL
jgi:endonuclease YncB( thermonuclease family)